MLRRIVPVLCLAACFGPALQEDTALLRESTEPTGAAIWGSPGLNGDGPSVGLFFTCLARWRNSKRSLIRKRT
jgi:hypothetical protein